MAIFNRKRKEKRKQKKQEGVYSFWDGVVDVLFWIPELVVLPFRLLFYLFRGIGRIFGDFFDAF